MIDEEKIVEAAIKACIGIHNDNYKDCMKLSFYRGIEWFKEAIWHEAKEEPEEHGYMRAKSVMKQTEHNLKLIGRITLWITTSLSGVMSKIC